MSEIRDLEITGRCACGAVVFKAHGPMRPVIACHCGTCRRTSGHYWAATQVYDKNFELMEDRGLKWFDSSESARRGFCGECGSSLFFQRHGAGRISIAGGALDAPSGLREAEQICTGEAGDYYDLNETVPSRSDGTISERLLLP